MAGKIKMKLSKKLLPGQNLDWLIWRSTLNIWGAGVGWVERSKGNIMQKLK